MISYFIKTGGNDVSDFSNYVHRNNGFKTILDKYTHQQDFGTDLQLLLIKYIVDGEIITFKENKNKISPYSEADKDISVDVHVRKQDFWQKNELERKAYIVHTTLQAVEIVQQRLIKKKLSIHFDLLKQCIAKAQAEYLENYELLAA